MSNLPDRQQRSVLPIPDRAYTGLVTYDADETTDLGGETGSPVSEDYSVHGNDFTGTVNWVQLDISANDEDHLITPEERFRVSMGRQ